MSRKLIWLLSGLGWFSLIGGHPDQAVSLFVGALVLDELRKTRTE